MRRSPADIWRWAVVAAALTTALAGCEGRPQQEQPPAVEIDSSAADPHIAEIDLRGGAPELPEAALLAPVGQQGFAHLVTSLLELGDEAELRGLFVRLGTVSLPLAQAHEIGRRLADFRQQELRVTCHADGLDNATMLLAALGCSEIWLSPAGTVDTVGLAGEMLFARTLLEKLSVRADFVQVGKHKGASEPFTRDRPSPEARQSLASTLRSLRQAWLAGIAQGRGRDAASLGLEDGPHTAGAAHEIGLVDRLGYAAESRQQAPRLAARKPTAAPRAGLPRPERPRSELRHRLEGLGVLEL